MRGSWRSACSSTAPPSIRSWSSASPVKSTRAWPAAPDETRQTFRRDVRGVSFSALALDLTASIYAQVWDADGTLVARNAPLLDRPLDEASLSGTRSAYSTVRLNSVPLLVLTYPLVTTREGELVGHLQLAASLQTVEAARQLVLSVLLIGGVLAVGFAALVGWSTAGTALRPLDAVTNTELQITRADDLSRSIPLRGPPQHEVRPLIPSFNYT